MLRVRKRGVFSRRRGKIRRAKEALEVVYIGTFIVLGRWIML